MLEAILKANIKCCIKSNFRLSSLCHIEAVAHAGFWKGGARKFENNDDESKISPLGISENLKKKVFTQI